MNDHLQNGGRMPVKGFERVDRRLMGILAVFFLAALILLGIMMLGTDTISALRSYSTMQAHWTEIRKEGVGQLKLYALTGEERYLEAYRQESLKLQALKDVRGELEQASTDRAYVMRELGRLRFEDYEIRGMIRVYKRFGDQAQLAAAIENWIRSDRYLSRLDSLADTLASAAPPTSREPDVQEASTLTKIERIDSVMTDLQYGLARDLEQGTSYLRSVVLYSGVVTGVLLFLIGGYMARRYMLASERARRRIESQLEEKTVLLAEIHHRVKNNLAFVSSLLMLQEDEIRHLPAQQKLKEAQNQLVSIADVHEIIYNTENFSELTVQRYFEQILNRLSGTMHGSQGEVTCGVDANDTRVPLNEAIPFGLILNELATNSFKHAFDAGQDGRIHVRVRSDGAWVHTEYRDNGRGVPPGFRIEEAAESSLGMKLIHTFLKQLEADYELIPGHEGFGISFSFRIS